MGWDGNGRFGHVYRKLMFVSVGYLPPQKCLRKNAPSHTPTEYRKLGLGYKILRSLRLGNLASVRWGTASHKDAKLYISEMTLIVTGPGQDQLRNLHMYACVWGARPNVRNLLEEPNRR